METYSTRDNIKNIKYCVYLWAFKPEVDDVNLKGLHRALNTFFSDY